MRNSQSDLPASGHRTQRYRPSELARGMSSSSTERAKQYLELTSTVKASPTTVSPSFPLNRSRSGTNPPVGCPSLTSASEICGRDGGE